MKFKNGLCKVFFFKRVTELFKVTFKSSTYSFLMDQVIMWFKFFVIYWIYGHSPFKLKCNLYSFMLKRLHISQAPIFIMVLIASIICSFYSIINLINEVTIYNLLKFLIQQSLRSTLKHLKRKPYWYPFINIHFIGHSSLVKATLIQMKLVIQAKKNIQDGSYLL